MKKIVGIFLIGFMVWGCKKKGSEVDPAQTPAEIISLTPWKLDRYTQPTGEPISNNVLNPTALLLYAMNFEFMANGEVRGVDKVSGSIIDKGVWHFIDNETGINVQLSPLNHDFRIINITTGKMILRAPTGNFLSGVGEQLNLEFSSVIR